MKISISILLVCLLAATAFGQKKESGELITPKKPLDGFYEKDNVKDKKVLSYDHVREADVFWEKRIWRVIDVREKMNKHFAYPKAPFVNILLEAAKRGDITVYSNMDDEFNYPMTTEEAANIGSFIDTTLIIDPFTMKEEYKIYRTEFNWENVKRFRIKEVWYFDEETATMKSRILGIAPLVEEYDDNDNFRYEKVMFWAYYPEVRKVLGNEEVFNTQNITNQMSWDNIFEMRYFSSYIYKESNVYDKRIQDYKSGMDVLLEANRIHDALFDFEQDLWSY